MRTIKDLQKDYIKERFGREPEYESDAIDIMVYNGKTYNQKTLTVTEDNGDVSAILDYSLIVYPSDADDNVTQETKMNIIIHRIFVDMNYKNKDYNKRLLNELFKIPKRRLSWDVLLEEAIIQMELQIDETETREFLISQGFKVDVLDKEFIKLSYKISR